MSATISRLLLLTTLAVAVMRPEFVFSRKLTFSSMVVVRCSWSQQGPDSAEERCVGQHGNQPAVDLSGSLQVMRTESASETLPTPPSDRPYSMPMNLKKGESSSLGNAGFSFRTLDGAGVWGEGELLRIDNYSPTEGRPHPNPLPDGEGTVERP